MLNMRNSIDLNANRLTHPLSQVVLTVSNGSPRLLRQGHGLE
jgi:hypothetical protein